MLKPESRTLLKELGKLNHGRALRELLDEELAKINDITTCSSWEEAVGRKYAIKLIKEIFAWMDKEDLSTPRRTSYN